MAPYQINAFIAFRNALYKGSATLVRTDVEFEKHLAFDPRYTSDSSRHLPFRLHAQCENDVGISVAYSALIKLMSPLRSSRATCIFDKSSVFTSSRISSSRSCLEMWFRNMFLRCSMPFCTSTAGVPFTRNPKACE